MSAKRASSSEQNQLKKKIDTLKSQIKKEQEEILEQKDRIKLYTINFEELEKRTRELNNGNKEFEKKIDEEKTQLDKELSMKETSYIENLSKKQARLKKERDTQFKCIRDIQKISHDLDTLFEATEAQFSMMSQQINEKKAKREILTKKLSKLQNKEKNFIKDMENSYYSLNDDQFIDDIGMLPLSNDYTDLKNQEMLLEARIEKFEQLKLSLENNILTIRKEFLEGSME